jgi:hypothetical protein
VLHTSRVSGSSLDRRCGGRRTRRPASDVGESDFEIAFVSPFQTLDWDDVQHKGDVHGLREVLAIARGAGLEEGEPGWNDSQG